MPCDSDASHRGPVYVSPAKVDDDDYDGDDSVEAAVNGLFCASQSVSPVASSFQRVGAEQSTGAISTALLLLLLLLQALPACLRGTPATTMEIRCCFWAAHFTGRSEAVAYHENLPAAPRASYCLRRPCLVCLVWYICTLY